jgi:hypothetical protein
VTFDPKIGFILDPVTTLDAGTYRCEARDMGDLYSSSEFIYETSEENGLEFTLDVSKYFTE